MHNSPFRSIPWLFLIYLILLLVHGYLFGRNDMVEVLPYALYLNDSSLYPSDFYIQNISAAIPNERYLYSFMLSLAEEILPVFCLILHFLVSMSLLLGLYRLTGLFMPSQIMRYASLLTLLVPLYGINLGGNELYYNMMVSSVFAKGIAVWSLYFFIEKKNVLAWTILLPAVLIHPVAAGQLALLFIAVRCWEFFIGKKHTLTGGEIMAWVVFLIVGGGWIYLLQRHFASGNISNALILDIFRFRLPHHYLPSAFPLTSWIVLIPLIFGGGWLARRNTRVWLFMGFAILGLIVYTMAVEVFGSTFFLSSQWFKSTIWLKALALFSVAGWIDNRFFPGLIWFFEKNRTRFLAIGLLLASGLLIWPVGPFNKVERDLPWNTELPADREIALLAKEYTPKDATFIIPLGMTSFKYFSRRSLYVDYKSMVHRKDALPRWYKRVTMIYGLEWAGEYRDNYEIGQANYFVLKTRDVKGLSKLGIDFIVTEKGHVLDLPEVVSNNQYKIYRIP